MEAQLQQQAVNQQAEIEALKQQIIGLMQAAQSSQTVLTALQAATTTTPSTSSRRQWESVMDTKMINKAKPFDGSRENWRSWEFHWKAYMVAHDHRYLAFIKATEASTTEVDNAALTSEEQQLSTQLYFMLVMAMPDDSVGELIMRSCPEGQGACAWQRLLTEYNPQERGDLIVSVR